MFENKLTADSRRSTGKAKVQSWIDALLWTAARIHLWKFGRKPECGDQDSPVFLAQAKLGLEMKKLDDCGLSTEFRKGDLHSCVRILRTTPTTPFYTSDAYSRNPNEGMKASKAADSRQSTVGSCGLWTVDCELEVVS